MSNTEISMPAASAAAGGRQASNYASSMNTNSVKAIDHIASTVKAASAASAISKAATQPTEKNVGAAVIEINQVFQSANTSLAFYVDKSSQRFVVEVKDTNTGESIVKFPGEAALRIAESIESLKGVLFDKTL
ncbi:flagellar protein FlaG [Porticoccaceae bacterium]|nr:flagellar protein FlaG [Porticoccaceae bacterium]